MININGLVPAWPHSYWSRHWPVLRPSLACTVRNKDELEAAPLDAVRPRPHRLDVTVAVRGGGLDGKLPELADVLEHPVDALSQSRRVQDGVY